MIFTVCQSKNMVCLFYKISWNCSKFCKYFTYFTDHTKVLRTRITWSLTKICISFLLLIELIYFENDGLFPDYKIWYFHLTIAFSNKVTNEQIFYVWQNFDIFNILFQALKVTIFCFFILNFCVHLLHVIVLTVVSEAKLLVNRN